MTVAGLEFVLALLQAWMDSLVTTLGPGGRNRPQRALRKSELGHSRDIGGQQSDRIPIRKVPLVTKR